MFENLDDRVTKSLATVRGGLIHGGLIRMPMALAAALDAEVPQISRIALGTWFELPRDQQAPPSLLAMYKLTDDALTLAIIDERARTLHAVLEGSPDELLRFVTTLVKLSREDPDSPSIKVPGDGPGGTPGVAASRSAAG
jgi:hypothetical protein